jgi:hypothetical protein
MPNGIFTTAIEIMKRKETLEYQKKIKKELDDFMNKNFKKCEKSLFRVLRIRENEIECLINILILAGDAH